MTHDFYPTADALGMQLASGHSAAESILPAGTTRADFCTRRFRILADVFTGERRLLDIMRDSSRQYLEARRLSVRPIDSVEQHVEYADGLLNKAEIDWVAIRAEPSRAKGRLYGFVRKSPVGVALVLGSHRIEGNVFTDSSATDPVSFFLRGIEKSTERFLAVASATLTSSAGDVEEAGLVIVSRNAVSLFSVVR